MPARHVESLLLDYSRMEHGARLSRPAPSPR